MRHRFLGEMEGALAEAGADRTLEQIEADGRGLLPVLQCRRAGVIAGLAFSRPREAEAAFLLARHSDDPRGVVARLNPVPDVWDGRGAVASGVVHRWYRRVPDGGTSVAATRPSRASFRATGRGLLASRGLLLS